MSNTGVQRSISRGAGNDFGLDVLQQWMESNHVHTFVRSHQAVPFGYQQLVCNDPALSVYTVFSSADYRGADNEGAVLELTKQGLNPIQYEADDMVPPPINDPLFVQDTAVQYSKDVVASIFHALDTDHNGILDSQEFAAGLAMVRDFRTTQGSRTLPVDRLDRTPQSPESGINDRDDSRDHESTITERTDPENKSSSSGSSLGLGLAEDDLSDLQAAFDMLDKDGRGGVSIAEFLDGFGTSSITESDAEP